MPAIIPTIDIHRRTAILAAAGLVLLALALGSPARAIPPTVPCTFTVSPARGASIKCSLDGSSWKSVGIGQTTKLLAGTWHFHVSAKGYKPLSTALSISGASFRHTFRLEPLPPPETKVMVKEITPPDAGLMLDGRPIRAGVWVNVSPGSHTITSKLRDDFSYSFTIKSGEHKTIPEIKVPDTGTVKVAIDPPVNDVKIRLVDTAGTIYGVTEPIPRGSYSIDAVLPEGCSLKNPQQTVNVQPGKQTDVLVSIVTPWFCDECRRYFESQAALDRHTIEHTWVMIEQIQPADAELVLDGRTPIKRGEKITVSPGRHTITGESSRGYLKEPYEKPYEFTMTAGKPETIAKITVPDNAPPSVKIGSVDPPTAAITVNGRSAEANSTVKIVPEGSAESVNISVVVEKEDYRTWTEAREVRWKEVWEIPNPVTLPRLRWGEVCRTVDPGEMDEYTRVWLVDSAGVEHEIKYGPKCTRIDLDDAKQRQYTVKIKPPTDYRVKDAPSDVTIVDHERTTISVKLEKKPAYLQVVYVPMPVASVSVYDGSGASRGPGDNGRYELLPDTAHVFVFKAFGFKDLTLTVTLQPGEERTEIVRMIPLPAFLKLTTKLSCGGDRRGHAIVELTDTAGTVVAKDTSETAEKTIELSPGEDGSDKTYHYRVSKDGFMKDLHSADWQGDIVAQRGKTVSLPDTMVLKCIRQVLEDESVDMLTNPCDPRGDLTAEELEIAARLADSPTLSGSDVKHGWGCHWRDMAKEFRDRAAKLRELAACVKENDPCVPREGLTLEQLQRATKLAETLSIKDCQVRPGCGCTWGAVAKKFRQVAQEIRARTDSSPTGGSK